MFKKILLTAVFVVGALLSAQHAWADVYVRGYVRSNGTYVAPHYRSNPDHNFYNNWSTYPNINPHTGQMGTRLTPPYSPSITFPSYGSSSSSFPAYAFPKYAPSSSYAPGYGWPR